MVRWLAPILSFTSEEIWRFMPGERPESVFLTTWYETPEAPKDTIDWPALIALRGDVTRELEKLREAGTVGSPLDAEIDVYCVPDEFARFATLGEELRFLFITSHARVHKAAKAPEGAVPAVNTGREGVWLTVKRTADPKCPRCWQRRPDVGQNAEHPELCSRCATNVAGAGEVRRFV
jgi:isoleucyl-tRNA synthetase